MTSNTNSKHQHSHRRKGKVARLPQHLRETVNTMLQDGLPYDNIIAKLRDQGFSMNRSNLTRWKQGGYQDHCQERLWLQEMQSNLDFIIEHLRDNDGSKIPEAAVQLSSIRLFQFLRDFTDAAARGEPNSNSTDFIRAANAACRLSQTTTTLKTLKSVATQSNQVSAR